MLDASTVRPVHRDAGLILAGLEAHGVPKKHNFRLRLLESGTRDSFSLLQIVDVELRDAGVQAIGDLHVPRPHPRQQTTHEDHANQGDQGRDPALH